MTDNTLTYMDCLHYIAPLIPLKEGLDWLGRQLNMKIYDEVG